MKRTVIVVALACLLIAVTGCGAKKQVAIPADTATTALAKNPVNDAVLRDYRAFWDDFEAVTLTMTPGNPQIAAHSTGDELTQLNSIVLAGHQKGSIYKGTLDLDPRVQSVVGDTAVVDDCYVDHTGEYVVATGDRLDKDDPSLRKIIVTLKNVDETWKVSIIDKRSASCTR